MPLGVSFSPFQSAPMTGQQPSRTNPAQDAIKLLSFKLPTNVGPSAIAPQSLIAGGPTAMGTQLGSAVAQNWLKALLQGSPIADTAGAPSSDMTGIAGTPPAMPSPSSQNPTLTGPSIQGPSAPSDTSSGFPPITGPSIQGPAAPDLPNQQAPSTAPLSSANPFTASQPSEPTPDTNPLPQLGNPVQTGNSPGVNVSFGGDPGPAASLQNAPLNPSAPNPGGFTYGNTGQSVPGNLMDLFKSWQFGQGQNFG